MAGIVILTTKGEAKRDFVNALQKETGGAVALAVLQNVRRKSFLQRVVSFFKKVGVLGLVPELYHFLAVKLSRQKKDALALISLRSRPSFEEGYLADTLETDDVNGDDVYERVNTVRPDIIVMWGGYIVKPRLLELARRALNMHFGFTPYYRGVNGVQHAILRNDFTHVGITIHYAVTEVDAGEIIRVVTTDYRKSPESFFRELNDKATREYLAIAKRIARGEEVPGKPQDLALGRNYFLKEWTYARQDALARKLLAWQKHYSKPEHP